MGRCPELRHRDARRADLDRSIAFYAGLGLGAARRPGAGDRLVPHQRQLARALPARRPRRRRRRSPPEPACRRSAASRTPSTCPTEAAVDAGFATVPRARRQGGEGADADRLGRLLGLLRRPRRPPVGAVLQPGLPARRPGPDRDRLSRDAHQSRGEPRRGGGHRHDDDERRAEQQRDDRRAEPEQPGVDDERLPVSRGPGRRSAPTAARPAAGRRPARRPGARAPAAGTDSPASLSR